MMEIRAIAMADCTKAHALQCEYLDSETMNSFIRGVECKPNVYLTAVDGDEVVGVCYGHPSGQDDSIFVLQGIAVNLDEAKGYARVGIGSRLIAAFESVVKQKGYRKIGVGSADDPNVESFYVKNGFSPIEVVAKGLHHEEMERVKVDDFETGNAIRQDLRLKHRPSEVIFIFEKVLE